MNNPFFSIIIPIFNSEKYIENCLKSVFNQNFKDFELILIDDGSTDNSYLICENYIIDKTSVYLYHQENQGPSYSRNKGLKHAKGKYIIFLDSDDQLPEDALNHYYDNNNDCDIIFSNALIFRDNKEYLVTHSLKNEKIINNSEFYLLNQLKSKNMLMSPCFKSYNRIFLIESGVWFKTGIYHEDELWLPQVILKAEKIYTIDHITYHYIIRKNSITTQVNKEKHMNDLVLVAFELSDIYKTVENNKLKKLLHDYIANLYFKAIIYSKDNNDFDRIKAVRFLIGKGYLFKTRLKILLYLTSSKLFFLVYRRLRGNKIEKN